MIVERRDLDAALDQLLHHGVDFLVQKHEVAHHNRFAARLLEREVRAERERWPDLHAVERDLEIAAPQTDAVDPAWHFRAGPAKGLGDRRPVAVGSKD